MKVSIDTKEDSHEEIKKVIKMLQNLVGESGEIFTNDPSVSDSSSVSVSPMSNIFGDTSSASVAPSGSVEISSQETNESTEIGSSSQEKEETSQSTEDLFAELFSEEELKKMDPVKSPEDEDEEEELAAKPKSKSKKPEIEFY